MRKLVITGIALAISAVLTGPVEARQRIEVPKQDRPIVQRRIPESARKGAQPYVRTHLYFGTAKGDGTAVSEQEFRDFVDQVIARRFPDGLTVAPAQGQFKSSDGTVIKEQSFVVTLLYPADSQKECSRRINTIRQLYLNLHDQESVLRVDDPFVVWVSF